ncbi:MAG: M48 family metalloprotease [Deltaproteobacteria bacterium]|nr:M48 family metalloprotease [Deltaproteobacteria bacterium]
MALILSCLVGPTAGLNLPAAWAHDGLTTKQERELGEKFLLYAKENLTLIEDPCVVDYVNKIGHYLVSQNPSPPPFAFDFFVVKQDVYNAFAGPGGHIFIYTGLLAAMDNEDQLAGILAHEIGHVFARHISKQVAESKKIGLATVAGILAGIFLGGSPTATGAIANTSIAAGQSLSLRYSRKHEVEADQLGLKYLTRAGYKGKALLDILSKIRQKQWFGSEQVPTYLSTHPAVEARMAYLDTWIQAHRDWKPNVRPPTRSGDFNKVRTRVIALYGDISVAHRTFDAELRADPADVLANYGKGLVLDREGNKKEAVDYLNRALRVRPLDPDILRDLGKSQFNLGNYEIARKNLESALAVRPNDPEGRLLLGRAQMMSQDLNSALETFKGLVEKSPAYLPGTYYLGQTYGKLGRLAKAHYYLGMYYKEKGPAKTARFHLERALALSSGDQVRREAIRKALKALSAQKRK